MDKFIIGNLELGHLPDLGIFDLPVRIDTGAKTSSLHVDNIKKVSKNGKLHVNFDLHPDIYHLEETVRCSALVVDLRKVKSSNGKSEDRYVIETTFGLGDHTWPIQITLTNRQEMSYMMLLGREGMGERLYVDPSRSFVVQGNPVKDTANSDKA
ncbi:ribosomal protein S6 modification protein [Vibrio galatheae]|uniref:Ribosomal protein S6 modification protein n=1 Tax=Vibrio galatheae TaxID=579748 RepID=A0A0F4NIG7_9VIBR|nr:RimK/LysX family protein [Vibrio galatheae]KJY82734.1 ribosomal protein S6 modification protein [Vibrio galatheae]